MQIVSYWIFSWYFRVENSFTKSCFWFLHFLSKDTKKFYVIMNHYTRWSSILKLTHLSNFLCTRIQTLQKCNVIINIRLILLGFKIYICRLYDSGVHCQYYQKLRVVSQQEKGGGTEGGSGKKICRPVGDRLVCLALFKIIALSSARTIVCLPCNAFEYSVQSKSWVA